MIYELLVTSVKRALQAGRSGFAPVMRTRGMHPDLQSRLEALSGYRHDFTQGDPRNSVLLSHSVIESTAGKFSVLSRIVDAGSDHSGRSNKLAHHLALDGSEIRSATGSSPAVTLMGLERSGTFATQWNSEPNEKNPGQSISFPPTEPAQCRDWERYAGDAGWAGVLIDRALRGQPTWIICGRGTHMLPLFAEALALVEPARRWGISFTTHAITTTGFLWMVALDGSPEAQIARAQNRIPVIDTTRPCTTPEAGTYAQAARGLADVPWKSRTIPAGSQPLSKPSAAVVPTPGQSSALSATFKATPSPSVPLLRSAPPGLVLPPSIGSTAPIRQSGPSGFDPPPVVAGKSRKIWPILAVAIVLLLLLGGGGLLVYMNYPTIKKTVVALVDTQKKPPAAQTPAAQPPAAQPPAAQPPAAQPPADKAAAKAAADKAAADKLAEEQDAAKAATDKLAEEQAAAAKAAADKVVAGLPPVLASLEILLTAGDQLARIQATLTKKDPSQTDDDFQKWIEKDATLQILAVSNPEPGKLPGKPDKNTLIFEIPTALPPDKCTGAQNGAQGKINFTNPFTQATVDTEGRHISFRPQDSIDTFHTDQLATKKVLVVPSVIPLSNDKSDELLTFHPNAKEIQLVLLTPKPPTTPNKSDVPSAISLRQEEGKEKWSVTDEKSPGNKNVFEIDRSNPWSPKLIFNPGPNQDLGQVPSCKLEILSDSKASPKRIAVLQLLEPQRGEIRFEREGNALEWKPIDTTSFPSDAVPHYTPTGEKKITITPHKNKKGIVFAYTVPEDNPTVKLKEIVTYECPAKGGKLIPQSNIPNISFFFTPDNLYEVDPDELEKYLKRRRTIFNPQLAKVETLGDLRKGLEFLKTECDNGVKHFAAEEAKHADADGKLDANKPEQLGQKLIAQNLKIIAQQKMAGWANKKKSVVFELLTLDNVEKLIAFHHAFIADLEKATFEASVSWEVEPSEADKGLVAKLTEPLTEEQKTVRAVVPTP